MAKRNSYHGFYELVTIITSLAVVLYKFLQVVIEKDRLLEFVISTPILVCVYYFLLCYTKSTLPILLIPITVYFIYWCVILNCPKSVKVSTEEHWGDEEWWWSLNGWDFEEEVAKVFRKYGYKAKVTRKTGDGGVDIIMFRNKKKYVVQCKHYKEPTSPESVRALWGIKDEFKADEVILVASSGVSKQSLNFIKKKSGYTLYTLPDIIKLATNFDS